MKTSGIVLLAIVASGATSGCTPGPADSYLAWQRKSDGYRVLPRDVGTLFDLSHLEGDVSSITAGGQFEQLDDGTLGYTGGRPLDIGWGLDGRTAVPLDQDGLILWSFYGHLEDVAFELATWGIDPDDVFPVPAAFTPVIPDLFLELQPEENAAYVTGGHYFILLEDLLSKDVPLAANAGVVRHELGHALFHLLTTGSVFRNPPFGGKDTSVRALTYASLHEGFADSFASLSLDDPRFLEASRALSGRRVDGSAVVSDVTLPEEFLAGSSHGALSIYDPYPLGTVYASVVWDLREALNDPHAAFDVIRNGTSAWVYQGDLGDGCGLLEAWVHATRIAEAKSALCHAVGWRFDGFCSVSECP
jgi:hypothetical protein